MEERYVLGDRLGKGGLGAVYRAFDSRMNREVAIKRISTDGDPDLQIEATRQLTEEAGALASLQHPHIVTVYDVGSDEEGPYVVMELITGKTLDELIEHAPLTWQDFRELAQQTLEALIAAQDLGMVHRDLKPSNLMLNWLPSGKFQVKVVDFGLAQLVGSPVLKALGESDSIFGTISFMSPEHFERGELDARTDLYAIGCVFYYTLGGIYPFNGNTGNEVMDAHLHHRVHPLEEFRPDLPRWVCDWVMWHINRNPVDRPSSARESLQVFLQNDSAPQPPPTPTQPLRGGPPRPARPVATGPVQIPKAPTQPPSAKTQAAPRPLAPPEGYAPSIHTSPIPIPAAPTEPVHAAPAAASPVAVTRPGPGRPTPTRGQTYRPPPKPKRKPGEIHPAVKFVLIALVVAFIAAVAMHFLQKNNAEKRKVLEPAEAAP